MIPWRRATSPRRRPPRSTSRSGSSPPAHWSTSTPSRARTTRSSGSTPSASPSCAARTPSEQIGAFHIYKWFTGVDPPADGSIGVIAPNPALFFAVLQAVGPNLTPQTFHDAAFALPGTSQGLAISQPFLSYGEKGYWPEPDYLGVDDATAIWWDPTVTGPDEIRKDGVGMYQFVDGGQRYLPGQWPAVDKMFDPAGAVALYTTPPPGEAPGDYPSPAG